MESNDGDSNSWSFLEEQGPKGLRSPSANGRRNTDADSDADVPHSPTDRMPQSPCGSPWTLSPLLRSPTLSASILYHCLATLHRHDGNVLSVAIANGLVFTGSESDRVRVWKQPGCVDRGHVRTGRGMVRAMLAHDDTLFTAHRDRRVRAWAVSVSVSASADSLRSKKIATFPPRSVFLSLTAGSSPRRHRHEDSVTCLALYVREGQLYSGSADRTVKAWKLSARSHCVDSFVAHDAAVNAMAVSQEDGTLFTGSTDGSVKVWRRMYGDHSHAVVMALRFQSSPVNALVLGGRSSCVLYSGSSDGYVNVWEKEEAVSGRYRHGGFLQGHRFAVLCLAAAGSLVLSGSEDTTIRVWRREECGMHACVAVMEGHRVPVRCMATSVEGEGEGEGAGLLPYSASLDRMVKVWRLNTTGKDAREAATAVVGYEVSPVLSPTWVERKRTFAAGRPVSCLRR